MSPMVCEDGDGLNAAAGERDEPVVDVVIVDDIGGEAGDAGSGVAEEDAGDDRGARAFGEAEGEAGEGLPTAAPDAREHGGRGASKSRPAGAPGGRTACRRPPIRLRRWQWLHHL